jgi:hypothetical protein
VAGCCEFDDEPSGSGATELALCSDRLKFATVIFPDENAQMMPLNSGSNDGEKF